MTAAARVPGLVVALAAALGLAWASRVPVHPDPAGASTIRLAWSARPERLDECRNPTADEMAARPRHMQQDLVCDGSTASYALEVRVNDALLVQQEVHGGGWRRDRRLYVFRELRVAPGVVGVDVRFTRIGDASAGAASPARIDFVPSRLTFREVLNLSPREVVLVTYDADRQVLVARRADRRPDQSVPSPTRSGSAH